MISWKQTWEGRSLRELEDEGAGRNTSWLMRFDGENLALRVGSEKRMMDGRPPPLPSPAPADARSVPDSA
jgi:hypothetical protein